MIDLLLMILSVLLSILIPLVTFAYSRKRKLRELYEVMWEKSSKLKPDKVLGIRGKSKFGFHKYYYHREMDDVIKKKIELKQNVLIIGKPLAGKSRAVYETLTTLKEDYAVIIPRLVDINIEEFRIPFRFCFWRKTIIFLDDINKFVEKRNFMHLLRRFIERHTIIIATCRSGPEYEILFGKMEGELFSIFGDPVEISKISRRKGEEIVKKTGRKLASTFDGTIGSIFLQLETMRDRFRSCSGVEKGILRSIRRLYYARIYREREVFLVDRIKHVSKMKEEIERKHFEWVQLLEELEKKGFIEIVKDMVRAEEAHLEAVFEDDFSILGNLYEMMDIFSNDPETLFGVGTQACHIASGRIPKNQLVEYIKLAIKALDKALETFTLERFPYSYASTQNNLGIAYKMLARVEGKAENCKKAIKSYNEALKVRPPQQDPIEYAMALMNIGSAYCVLAEVEDKAENCKKAIETLHEALGVEGLGSYLWGHAAIYLNLGVVYDTLAEVEDKAKNCKKAIKAHNEALKILNPEHYPQDYGNVFHNLGESYEKLAEVEDKAENCKRAIKAYKEALKLRTPQHNPIEFAFTQRSLGGAFQMLAHVENKAKNCNKSIKAYKESLRIWTLECYPRNYAEVLISLGNTYRILAEVKDKAKNCKKAMKTLEEAKKIITPEVDPINYFRTQNNLGNAHFILADVENKAENCKRAIKAYKEALKLIAAQQIRSITH